MNLWRPLDRGPRLRERLSGPHRTEVTLGGGRAWTPAVPPPCDAGGQRQRPARTAAPTPAATMTGSRQTTATTAKTGVPPNTIWPVAIKISPTGVMAGGGTLAPPLLEMTCGIVGHLLAWEDHTCHLCTSNVAGSCPKVPLWAFACFPGRFRFIIP